MKQVTQDLRSGRIRLVEVPCPQPDRASLLVATRASLLSAGTERMLLEFGRANVLDKIRQQPDKFQLVLQKMRTDGVLSTLDAVKAKLDQPLALGYSNVGRVLEAAHGFHAGERIVSNAPHAEVGRVLPNLCARVPEGVSDEAAAFTVVGAIALQGIRLAAPVLGESVAVIGLGLIGLLTVQLLKSQGCRVLGVDLDEERVRLAQMFGAETVSAARREDPVAQALRWTQGRGVDAVLIAAATRSSGPVQQAARMSRQRGRVVLVGVTGLTLSRDDFYKKELSFQVSCSYGPGRYDAAYEAGHDYPYGFVRWTAQRNFEAVLDQMAAGRLQTEALITHRLPLAQAADAYEVLLSGQRHLGILLTYPQQTAAGLRRASVQLSARRGTGTQPVVACIGAGAHASKVLLPTLSAEGVRLHTIASRQGLTARHAAERFGFGEATTDLIRIWSDPAIDAVVIATRHDSHAALVVDALRAGKHVFVEKPLALTRAELEKIEQAVPEYPQQLLMVGFNRRFAPHARKIRECLQASAAPASFVMTVNAGAVPPEHWTRNPAAGGGRLIGEACHFVDLLRYVAAAPITSVQAIGQNGDGATFTLTFANGSHGTVHYWTNGHRALLKERLEVFCGGRVLQLNNWRLLRGYGWPGLRLWRQDKGHAVCLRAFLEAVRRGGPSPIPFEELVEVTRAAFDIAEAAQA